MGNRCQSSTDKLRQQDEEAEGKRIAAENAEEVTLVIIRDHDGKKIDVTVRLNSTINQLKKAAAAVRRDPRIDRVLGASLQRLSTRARDQDCQAVY